MTKVPFSDKTLALLNSEIELQKLPPNFIETVINFYWPVAQKINVQGQDGLKFVGIQGSQGSGKSTIADFLKILIETEFQKQTLVMSIDDFYLTKDHRKQLAVDVHPLFLTRGVPNTHDIRLLNSVFDAAMQRSHFTVPIFDKSIDDRADEKDFQQITDPVDLVILEGWCVGLSEQCDSQIEPAINDLEIKEDEHGVWRSVVNQALKSEYKDLFNRLDYQVFLQAPSFECVYDWRLLQEKKMIERLRLQGKDVSDALTKPQIVRFISHYQRLTEHALASMPQQSDCVITLKSDHSLASVDFY